MSLNFKLPKKLLNILKSVFINNIVTEFFLNVNFSNIFIIHYCVKVNMQILLRVNMLHNYYFLCILKKCEIRQGIKLRHYKKMYR